MQRAADRKPQSAQEGEGGLAFCVINFSSFTENLLIFEVTNCWVHDEAFLCNILGGNHANTDPKGFIKKIQTFLHLTVKMNP